MDLFFNHEKNFYKPSLIEVCLLDNIQLAEEKVLNWFGQWEGVKGPCKSTDTRTLRLDRGGGFNGNDTGIYVVDTCYINV